MVVRQIFHFYLKITSSIHQAEKRIRQLHMKPSFLTSTVIDCRYSLEPRQRGRSNEYPETMFWIRNKKTGIPLQTKVVFFSIKKWGIRGYSLHGHGILMKCLHCQSDSLFILHHSLLPNLFPYRKRYFFKA